MLTKFYTYINDLREEFSQLRSDSATVEKKDEANVEQVLPVLKNKPFVSLFTSLESLKDELAGLSGINFRIVFCELIIDTSEFKLQPDTQEKFFLVFPENQKIQKENIDLCFLLTRETEILYRIKEINDPSRWADVISEVCTSLKYRVPPYTPTSIVQRIELIGKKVPENLSNALLKNYIGEVAQHFCFIKEEMKQFLMQNCLPENRASFLKFINIIEDIEKAINKALQKFEETQEISLKIIPFEVDIKAPVLNKVSPQQLVTADQFNSNAPILKNKAGGYIEEEQVDLKKYPLSHGIELSNSDQLILGDLHANMIKLLYFLIHENVVRGISELDYENIYTIHINSMKDKLTHEDINRFKKIIKQLSPVNPDKSPQIYLIGDVLADRSGNDYLTLLLIAQIKALKIPLTIIVSNHDREFLGAHERGEIINVQTVPWLAQFNCGISSNQSLINLGKLIKKKLVGTDEIEELIEKIYLPLLQGISISINEHEKRIIFITHAPVGLSIVNEIVNEMSVSVRDFQYWWQTLATKIYIINQCITRLCQNKKFYEISPKDSALYELMWYRIQEDDLGRLFSKDHRLEEQLPEGWHIDYVHGHDGSCRMITLDNGNRIIGLNNELGRMYDDEKSSFPPKKYNAYYFGDNIHFLSKRADALKNMQQMQNQSKTSLSNSNNVFFASLNTQQLGNQKRKFEVVSEIDLLQTDSDSTSNISRQNL